MSGQLVECVPNFSEGTDARRVEAIVAAMCMDGVRLLDWSMDASHNRSVVTVAGEPAIGVGTEASFTIPPISNSLL